MMNLPTAYGEYGNAQDAFGYLSTDAQAEIVEHCHATALMMNDAADLLTGGAIVKAARAAQNPSDALNSAVQEAPTRALCAAILAALNASEVRTLADLAYLNTEASPAWLRRALHAERWNA